MWDIIALIAVFLSGCVLGRVTGNWDWQVNWMKPHPMTFGGTMYKVVRLDRWRESMNNLAEFEPER